MKRTLTETKIDEAFEVAMSLSDNKATQTERNIFRSALRKIAVAAIDDARDASNELMRNESKKYE